MKDYSITIEVSFDIEARNEEQAQERAALMAEALATGASTVNGKWLGEVTVEEPKVEEN